MSVTQAKNGEIELHTHETKDVLRCLHALEDAAVATAEADPMAVTCGARKLWKMKQPRLNDD